MLRPIPLLALVLGASAIAASVQVSGAAGTSGFVADSQPGQERKEARPPPGSGSPTWTPTATAGFAR